MVMKRLVGVTNTPDLFSPALSPEEQDVRRRFHQSSPETRPVTSPEVWHIYRAGQRHSQAH